MTKEELKKAVDQFFEVEELVTYDAKTQGSLTIITLTFNHQKEE